MSVDIERAQLQFTACLGHEGDVDIRLYIQAYEEIVKIFAYLGSVFKFVSNDVTAKLAILREKETDSSYRSVQSMISHEIEHSLTNTKNNGCRTLLRLHRALAFISAFMKSLDSNNTDENLSNSIWAAYNDTLSPHHTWTIRKTVGAAMYMLPNKCVLVNAVGGPEVQQNVIPKLIESLDGVYNAVQRMYVHHDLLALK